MKKSSYLKVLTIVISVFFALFLVEVGMRLVGHGILAVQEMGNEIRSEDSTALRILTVGESTTADPYSKGFRHSWPRQLEVKLQDKGIKVRVYNVARPGTTTSAILERLPEQLDHFNPNIVISMMGINDANTPLFRDQFWWENLRVFKLYRVLIANLRGPDEFPSKNFSEPEATRDILKGLQNADIGPALSLIEQQTRKLNDKERSQYFSFLAESSAEYQFSSQTQIELMERALKARFHGGGLLIALADLLVREKKTEKCFNLASQFVNMGWIADDTTLHRFIQCTRLSSGMDPNTKEKWWKVLEAMTGRDVTSWDKKLAESSHRNFHKLLSDRKILHIEMQYATRPIERLKNYFAGESGKIEKDFQDIIFVENKGNFENALKKYSYEEIFSDRFAGTFGHTTDLGHSIYAEAVIPAVLEAVGRAARR